MKWCNNDLHTLSEQAKDRAKWRLVVQCAVDTHGQGIEPDELLLLLLMMMMMKPFASGRLSTHRTVDFTHLTGLLLQCSTTLRVAFWPFRAPPPPKKNSRALISVLVKSVANIAEMPADCGSSVVGVRVSNLIFSGFCATV